MKNEGILEILKELMTSYDEFYRSEPQEPFDLQAFSVWLFHREGQRVKSSSAEKLPEEISNSSGQEINTGSFHGSVDDQISFIFLSMHKLIKFYVKKALEGSQLVSIDDIHYLMFLSETESLTKSELINSNITEMSSGIEVIKRLLKKGLIEDFEDPDDKRSKRVRITQNGLDEIKKVTSKFGNMHKLLTSVIHEDEKFDLLSILSRIYHFHFNIFTNEKNTPLEELFKKYLDHDLKKNHNMHF